jgi:NAD(P)H-dependent FMN reductase
MTSVLVVTGSIRPNSINQKMVPVVAELAKAKGLEVTIADLGELNLPFYDNPLPPTSPDFVTDNADVLKWTDMVREADGVILVTPEYNHTMTPIQLNAVDWIGKEWNDKPIALVGYGWRSGAQQAHAAAREALAVNLKARVGDEQTNLLVTRELNPDGTIADQEATEKKINATIDELVELIEETHGE